MDVDAWGTEAAGILVDDGLALRTNLEGFYLEVGEQQTSLDADATRTETDVPQHMFVGKVEGLERQQSDRHLRNHLLSPVKKGERTVGKAKRRGER